MTLLKNVRFLVTQNQEREVLENVDVLIEDGEIVEIGRGLLDRVSADSVLDCSEKVVVPGLVNLHTHSSMTVLRGISDNVCLDEWLEDYIFPAEQRMGEEEVFLGSMLACIEMLETGTTCFNDMYFHMEEVADAVERSGIRAVLSHGLMDSNGEAELWEAENLVRKYKDHERIVPGIAPHSVYTCSEGLLLDTKELADKYGTVYHIHLSETRDENKRVKEEKGMTPTEYLDELAILDEDVVAAHATHLTQEDVIRLQGRKTGIAHNPAANLKLGSGRADIPNLRRRGLNIGLGTDGPASNNSLNLFDEAKTASLIHKEESPEAVTEQDILDMLTIDAAKALNLEDRIGSIEEGKKADLVTVDLNKPSMRPFHGVRGVISNLVYSFDGDVSEVFVNGELVVRNGEALNLDREKVFKAVQGKAFEVGQQDTGF
ncbi:MAG: amidohydrolase family protein [Candidatus Nanohalobium sp.]